MSEANASEGETVASKLLQKYFIAILKPQLVKTCSTAFCRLAAGGSVDFFYDCGLSVSFPVCPTDWQLFPAVRPSSLDSKKMYKYKCTTCEVFNNVSAVQSDICGPACVMCIWLSCLWLLRFFFRTSPNFVCSHFFQLSTNLRHRKDSSGHFLISLNASQAQPQKSH